MRNELLINLLRMRLERGESIDVPGLVVDLEKQGVDPGEAFEELLNDPKSFEYHYYAVAGMRTLAEQGRLRRAKARSLLAKTERMALQLGVEEFFQDNSVRSSF